MANAHNNGEKDYKTAKEKSLKRDLFQTFIHAIDPTDTDYKPPKGKEDEYKKGWDNAKKQNK